MANGSIKIKIDSSFYAPPTTESTFANVCYSAAKLNTPRWRFISILLNEMLQKSCLGEVCQYLWVSEITRTSSTQSVGLPPPQPGSTRYGSAALTLPFVTQERNTLGFTGSGNRVAVSETKVALLLSPPPHTHMNDLRIFLCMGNECGFCSAFQNGLFGVQKILLLGQYQSCDPEQIPVCSLCRVFF